MDETFRGLLLLFIAPAIGIWFWRRLTKKQKSLSPLLKHTLGCTLGAASFLVAGVFIVATTSPDTGARVWTLTCLSAAFLAAAFFLTRTSLASNSPQPQQAVASYPTVGAMPVEVAAACASVEPEGGVALSSQVVRRIDVPQGAVFKNDVVATSHALSVDHVFPVEPAATLVEPVAPVALAIPVCTVALEPVSVPLFESTLQGSAFVQTQLPVATVHRAAEPFSIPAEVPSPTPIVTSSEPSALGFTQTLQGLRIAFTGSLPSLERSEAVDLAQAAGATVTQAVNKKTDYMVCGYEAGSRLARAEELGVPVIDEEGFLELLPPELAATAVMSAPVFTTPTEAQPSAAPKSAAPARRRKAVDETFTPQSSATRERRTERACAQLLGLIGGITADGQLHDLEIQFLRTWLAEKRNEADHWLYSQLAAQIDHIMADGVITDAERAELLEVLKGAAGIDFANTGSVTAETMTFPADDGEVHMAGRNVCLTGKFLFGARGDAEQATTVVGGLCVDRVTKTTHYLVIGSAGATTSWKQASYGRKIEAAMKLKEQGHPILIVTEEQWSAGLALQQA